MGVPFFPEYYENISRILGESEVTELKWHILSSAKKRFAALKIIEYTIDCAKIGKLRVDVLIWDTYDSRHKIPRRDDLINLEKMYYKLLKNVTTRRWGDFCFWAVFPDEQSAIDWIELETITDRGIIKEQRRRAEISRGDTPILKLEKIVQVKSHECPPVQVADLFAGLGVHSRKSIREHVSFFMARHRKSCRHLSDRHTTRINEILKGLSRRDKERCEILEQLFLQCKANNWGIHLLRTKGLKTTNPSCPINFWHYTPQSELDTAPTKMRVIPHDRENTN
jgi:hypothetical protein